MSEAGLKGAAERFCSRRMRKVEHRGNGGFAVLQNCRESFKIAAPMAFDY